MLRFLFHHQLVLLLQSSNTPLLRTAWILLFSEGHFGVICNNIWLMHKFVAFLFLGKEFLGNNIVRHMLTLFNVVLLFNCVVLDFVNLCKFGQTKMECQVEKQTFETYF